MRNSTRTICNDAIRDYPLRGWRLFMTVSARHGAAPRRAVRSPGGMNYTTRIGAKIT